MHGQMVSAIVALTLGLLLTTGHAGDVTRNIPTTPAQQQERAGSSLSNSGAFLNSLREADDGEYVIFNSKGDPEAAVVVTKDTAKATEESNIRSIYEWMQQYIDKNQKTVTAPGSVKKTPYNYQPDYPRENYAAGYYAPPPYAQNQFNPVPPYNPYRPAGGFYQGRPNNAPYQHDYPQDYYNYQTAPPKMANEKKPYVTHTEIITGANKRPVHVYNVAPNEYAWPSVQSPHRDPNAKGEVIRGAHTTPDGKPWPPAGKVQKNGHYQTRFAIVEQDNQMVRAVPQEGYADMSDVVTVQRYPTRYSPESQQVVTPSKDMYYRSWLAGQVGGSNVNYNDETMSAYLLSKFAPFAEQQAYGVRSSVVKTKKKNNGGAKKGPVRYLPAKQNEKRYSFVRPQFYAVEEVEATPQMFSRYAPVKDVGVQYWQNDGDSQQGYAVRGVDGIVHVNKRFDALKALTGYTRSQIDQMMDGRRGNDGYVSFYSPDGVQSVTKRFGGGAKYSTGYASKNSDAKRVANFPQLYLFPGVDRNTQTVSLYGGAKQEGATPNGYMEVMRNINLPPRKQLEVPTPVIYQAPNQRFGNAFSGYVNDQGRNVDYKSLISFIRGMNGISNKAPQIRHQSATVKSRPQYFIVEEPDHVAQKYDNVRAVNGYTKAQIDNIIVNNLMRRRGSDAAEKYTTQAKYVHGVEPWQQFRNSERNYPRYEQPLRQTFAVRPPVMAYGY